MLVGEMWFTQNECVAERPWLPCLLVCLMWWLCFSRGSTVDDLGEDEQRVVVVLFVVIDGAVFVFGRESSPCLQFGRVLWVGLS